MIETKDTTFGRESKFKEEKRINPTWEAFGKYKGAFTYVDPEMLD